MSIDLAATRVTLRPVTTEDHEFLLALYGSTRTDLALLPLDDAQRDALVRMQFHAQDSHYRQTNPHATYDVIEIDGVPVGRLYVDRRARDIRIIDISLLPEHRDAGIGTALIRSVQQEAAATGHTVSLHVRMGNRAADLYRRLGFCLAEDLGVYRRLVWAAP